MNQLALYKQHLETLEERVLMEDRNYGEQTYIIYTKYNQKNVMGMHRPFLNFVSQLYNTNLAEEPIYHIMHKINCNLYYAVFCYLKKTLDINPHWFIRRCKKEIDRKRIHFQLGKAMQYFRSL